MKKVLYIFLSLCIVFPVQGMAVRQSKSGLEEARRLVVDKEHVKRTKWTSRKIAEIAAPVIVFGGLLILFISRCLPTRDDAYYNWLGVARAATQDEVESAYKRAVLKYHPDHNKSPNATKEFQEFQKAANVLRVPKLRECYDYWGPGFLLDRQVDAYSRQPQDR